MRMPLTMMLVAGIAVEGAAAQQANPVALDGVRSATLASGGPRLVEHDIYYGLYSFRAAPGERVQLDLTSDAFDPYLELGRLDGDGRFESVAENDDADGLNSRIVHVSQEGGDYLVRARGVAGGSSGDYRLTLTRLGELTEPRAPIPLAAGRAVEGRLTGDDAVIVGEDGSITARPFHYYAFDAVAGQTYTVALRSAEFDTVLDLGAMTPLGFAIARSNDDAEGDAGGEGGTDSQIIFRAERAGPMVIRASALAEAGDGRYTIELR